MRLIVTLTYDAAPERVAAMLADANFHRAVGKETGDVHAHVTVETGPGTDQRITTSRRLPTAGLPEPMKSMVGREIVAVQTMSWADSEEDGSRSGMVSVVVEGTPVRLLAAAHLGPAHGGTAVTYDGELIAKVPFIGGRVERAAEPVVRAALEAEQRVGAQWLASRPG